MRIVVRAPNARLARDAQALLAAAGVEAAALPSLEAPAPDGEDIAIYPAPAPEGGFPSPERPPPLARLVGASFSDPQPRGTFASGHFLGAVALDAPSKLLGRQVEAWLRVAVAEEERDRRAATAAELQAPAPRPPRPRKLKALYIGAPSAMFLSLERALAEQGGLVAAAFSSYAGFDHLHDEPFDAVVLNGAADPTTAVSLCAALRRNATLYHLPTMVLIAPGDAATAAAAIERGAATVAELNAPCGASLAWLFEAVQRERRRRAAEHDIRDLRDIMGDPRTGLFRRAPFHAYLARLAADHHMSGRPLSLAALRVLPAHGAGQPSQETWRRGFTDIANLAGRLMRDTDAGAAISGDLIAVALPATPLRGAKRTAERIASVAECTAFASGETGAGPLVFEQSCAELQPGESGPGLLARALRAIEVEGLPAEESA